jgi:hypothetical protein
MLMVFIRTLFYLRPKPLAGYCVSDGLPSIAFMGPHIKVIIRSKIIDQQWDPPQIVLQMVDTHRENGPFPDDHAARSGQSIKFRAFDVHLDKGGALLSHQLVERKTFDAGGAVFANLRIDTAGIVKSYDPAASANCAIAIVDPGFNGLQCLAFQMVTKKSAPAP